MTTNPEPARDRRAGARIGVRFGLSGGLVGFIAAYGLSQRHVPWWIGIPAAAVIGGLATLAFYWARPKPPRGPNQ